VVDDQPVLPDAYRDLLEAPNTAVLTTLLSDGSPQGSPVWYWFNGTEVQVSTTAQRLKHRNVSRDPRVSLTLIDPASPLRYLEIRATVRLKADPTGAVRDLIAAKHGYDDGASFDPPGSSRVTLCLVPTKIIEH
jgi:PPOX class probable F420-dependent enzyme